MKKTLPLLIIVIFAFGRVAGQAIPHGHFNSWNTTPNWIDPAGYNTSNDQDITQAPGFSANVTQLSPWDNNISTTGYAVQLQTVKFNGDTFPAYITNSVNNPALGIGGVPFSGQPTGIQLWYNYSPATGDTAGMMVVFKKGGVILHTYLIPVTVAETSYPLVQFPFSPALTTTPDTVIFAAVSSINILEGKNGHPGTTFALSQVEFYTGSSSDTTDPADLNWNFDPWVGDTVFAPTGWTATFPGASRSTNAYGEDEYALELTTNSFNNNNNGDSVSVSIATTGILTNQGTIGGQPYTQTSDTLEFYYEYTPSVNNSGDFGLAGLQFIKNGTIIDDTGALLPAASSYTYYQFPFNTHTAPDSVRLSFLSSFTETGNAPLVDIGSTLLVDNVQFASQPLAGIKPVLLANNSIFIYPNPASSQVTISGSKTSINEVRLDNILGQTVLDKTYANGVAALKENIDVSNLPCGLYFISITSGNTTSTGKIMVSR